MRMGIENKLLKQASWRRRSFRDLGSRLKISQNEPKNALKPQLIPLLWNSKRRSACHADKKSNSSDLNDILGC